MVVIFVLRWGPIDRDFIDALAAPERGNTQSDRPVRSVLPDRGIPIVHELVAIVFEVLAEVIQHGPGFMTGRTPQSVFPGKCRQ